MKILYLTLGGISQPIVRALREEQPDRAVFFCTDRDLATGVNGSRSQLPEIYAASGFNAARAEVVLVPPDNLGECVRLMLNAFSSPMGRESLLQIADYTGGTKTMASALVLAAFTSQRVRLRVTTGIRHDLTVVQDRSERGFYMSLVRADFQFRFQAALLPWRRFAYAESVRLLEQLPLDGLHDSDCANHSRALELSRAFAAWDDFQHDHAHEILSAFRAVVGQELSRHLAALQSLRAEDWRQTPARILDLWRNAERCAAQGRYDDALARGYRFLEWIAQWLLKEHFKILTADVKPDQLPPDYPVSAQAEKKIQFGLRESWKLLARLAPSSPAGHWFQQSHQLLLGHLDHRNQSILAHGFQPVTAAQWQSLAEWITSQLLPVITAECGRLRGSDRPMMTDWPQLPDQFIWQLAASQ